MQKKQLFEIIGALVLLVSLIAVTALQAAPPSQNDDLATAKLTVLSGTAQVLRPDSTNWEFISDTTDLITGSRVRTDTQGIAILEWFGTTNRLEIFPNTEIFINEFTVVSANEFSIEITQFLGRTAHCIGVALQAEMNYVVNTPSTHINAAQSNLGVEVRNDYTSMLGLGSGSVLVEHQQSDARLVMTDNSGLVVPLASTSLPVTASLDTLPSDFVNAICNAENVSPFATAEPADSDGLSTQEPSDSNGTSPVITQEPADSSGGPVLTREPADDDGRDDDDDDNGGDRGGGGDDDRNDNDDDDKDDDKDNSGKGGGGDDKDDDD